MDRKIIWKYEIELLDTCTVRMPKGSQILDLQPQGGRPFIWVLTDPDSSEFEIRNFALFGTGHDILPKPGVRFVHIGTYHISSYVWHMFEEVSEGENK